MPETTTQLQVVGPGLCPHCAGEHARIYRPGAPEDRPQITSPEGAAQPLVPLLQDLDREQCVTLNLDVKHPVVATTTVSIGSVDHTFMAPREAFRDALLHGAGVVIAHNHPSGGAEPSRDDERIPAGSAKPARSSASKSSTTSSSATSAGSPSPDAAPSSSETPSPTSATTGPKR